MISIRSARNAFFFRLRQRSAGRGPFVERNEPKDSLRDHPASDRIRDLEGRYDLAPLKARSRLRTYLENLYLLDLLEAAHRGWTGNYGEAAIGIDAGCKNFFYAFGLFRFLERFRIHGTRKITLTGYEIDAYRVYTDLRSRADHARGYASFLPGTRFVAGDFLDAPGPADLVTALFPFVTKTPHLAWGLPLDRLHPLAFFAHALKILTPGGVLVTAAQGEKEFDAHLAILRRLKVEPALAERFESQVLAFKNDRYVVRVEKAQR